MTEEQFAAGIEAIESATSTTLSDRGRLEYLEALQHWTNSHFQRVVTELKRSWKERRFPPLAEFLEVGNQVLRPGEAEREGHAGSGGFDRSKGHTFEHQGRMVVCDCHSPLDHVGRSEAVQVQALPGAHGQSVYEQATLRTPVLTHAEIRQAMAFVDRHSLQLPGYMAFLVRESAKADQVYGVEEVRP